MSVDIVVYLEKSKLISPVKWAEAIKSNGFDMELDSDFDWNEFSGFLPCKYKGLDAGFELYVDEVSEDILKEDKDKIGNRGLAITLNTQSYLIELMTSTIASGVLCSITDGILEDTSEGKFTKAIDAILWSKNCEEEISNEL